MPHQMTTTLCSGSKSCQRSTHSHRGLSFGQGCRRIGAILKIRWASGPRACQITVAFLFHVILRSMFLFLFRDVRFMFLAPSIKFQVARGAGLWGLIHNERSRWRTHVVPLAPPRRSSDRFFGFLEYGKGIKKQVFFNLPPKHHKSENQWTLGRLSRDFQQIFMDLGSHVSIDFSTFL